jgi:uncharacterized protein YcbK (DUF882 family)
MNPQWTRRRWMRAVIAGGAGLALSPLLAAQESDDVPLPEERYLDLVNTHTNERSHVVFKRGSLYDPAALITLKNLLRDHRSGEALDMDPRLYDQLFELARAADCHPQYEIISGYRSPASNEKMSSRQGSGVAKKSLHMQGRAVDIRLKHCDCATLRDLALAVKQGGVGYYQRSDFVHIDTGTFRTWVG